MPAFKFPRIGLPLLARELTEMANRRRTYVLRVVYALLLFAFAYFEFYDILRNGSDPFALLGHGRRMFETLAWLEFAGIFLFMPIVGCTSITVEKEKNTLPLLLLTRLGPTTIILEKLLSRLVPMFVFLLLALPLLAFTYTLGGVSEERLWGTVVIMILTAVQVAAMTLMCSACYATTFSALIASYMLSFTSLVVLFCCGMSMAFNSGSFPLGIGGYLVLSCLLISATALFLVMARNYLVSRGLSRPNHAMERALNHPGRLEIIVDGGSGQMVVLHPGRSLPTDEPVAWRELTRASSMMFTPLIVVIEFALSLFLIPALLPLVTNVGNGELSVAVDFFEVLLWLILVVLLVVTTSGIISRERSRQTLEVLLTTPLTGREIVAQKLQPTWKLAALFWIPFGTLLFVRLLFWIKGGFAFAPGLRLLAGGVALLVYVPLVVWLTLWITLAIRSQGRAILLSFAVIGGWTFLPLTLPSPLSYRYVNPWGKLAWVGISPTAIFDVHRDEGVFSLLAIALSIVTYGVLMLGLRRYVLSRADVFLERVSDGEQQPVSIEADD